jgi:hypothetical protein
MKAKISPNLISFVPVRRGDWVVKVSVFKNKVIMVVAQHCYELEKTIVRYFENQDDAADFLVNLACED